MDRIIRTLIDRLAGKGIEISTIPAYIRDLANTLSVDAHLSLHELNRRMQLLGWDDFELDDHTLQLIVAIFETDRGQDRGQRSPFKMEGTPEQDKIAEVNNPNN